MAKRKLAVLGVGVLALCICSGCGGGGGGGGSPTGATPATTFKMADVTPPSGAGTEGGFIYSSFQDVRIDVTVPAADQLVSVYLKAVNPALYDSAGNLITPEQPVLLAQGQSHTSNIDGLNHFTQTLALPTSVTNVHIVPGLGLYPSSSTVSISNGEVKCEFKGVE